MSIAYKIAALALTSLLSGGVVAADLEIKDPWVRGTVPAQKATGAFMQLSSKAGVTLPTLYHYFGDKKNLYLESCLATFGPRAERALTAYSESGARDDEKVMSFFVDLASELLEDLLDRRRLARDGRAPRPGIRARRAVARRRSAP